MATRQDYLEEETDDTASRLNRKVSSEIKRLRRHGLGEEEIIEVLTEAVEWIFNHEENPHEKAGE